MDQHFSVRRGNKYVPGALELFTDRKIIFDDAVVNERNFVLAVGVGMGINVARNAVRRPTSVPNSGCRVQMQRGN